MVDNDKRFLAVIPARGGSQRIKKKNIVPFAGKPLLAWTIQVARESGAFVDIVVSTEDKDIAQIALQYGASVPFLRKNFADSESGVSLATAECVARYESDVSSQVTDIVQLMATCPLRTAEDICNALDAFSKGSAPAQISCAKQVGLNSWWSVLLDEHNVPTPVLPQGLGKKSQDLQELYCPSGSIWIADKQALLQEKNFYVENHVFYPISWLAAFDIDTPEELDIAERLMQGSLAVMERK